VCDYESTIPLGSSVSTIKRALGDREAHAAVRTSLRGGHSLLVVYTLARVTAASRRQLICTEQRDHTDSPDCLLLLLSISVFIFLVFLFYNF